jgi:hypothetical protein
VPLLLWPAFQGCQALSDRLTRWKMLEPSALEDPVQAVGGDAIVFGPDRADAVQSRQQLARLSPQELVAYYAPIFVQQRVDTTKLAHPYPPAYDQIGEARLRPDSGGKFKAIVEGPPTVYAIYQKLRIGPSDHVQLTYTAWYPAHPREKLIDVEEADIDSCVLRLTLDADNAPLFYETIAACGCFHKVFVQRRLEEAASQIYGGKDKRMDYAIERYVEDSISWEVAGLVDEPIDQPRRPVVFLKAGNHRVIGMGSASRLRVPPETDVRHYALTEYSGLYSVQVVGTDRRAPFFDLDNGGKVWGAQRKERFIFSLIGVDDAGQPRANDQIKLHFDQSTWSDPTIYEKYLRLPPGTL